MTGNPPAGIRVCVVPAERDQTATASPDGDGTGSMAGLASLLRARGTEAVIYSLDPIARRYRWLPLVSTVVHTMPFDERFDCTIVVDCADISLLGDALPPPEVCGVIRPSCWSTRTHGRSRAP